MEFPAGTMAGGWVVVAFGGCEGRGESRWRLQRMATMGSAALLNRVGGSTRALSVMAKSRPHAAIHKDRAAASISTQVRGSGGGQTDRPSDGATGRFRPRHDRCARGIERLIGRGNPCRLLPPITRSGGGNAQAHRHHPCLAAGMCTYAQFQEHGLRCGGDAPFGWCRSHPCQEDVRSILATPRAAMSPRRTLTIASALRCRQRSPAGWPSRLSEDLKVPASLIATAIEIPRCRGRLWSMVNVKVVSRR
jgi:hypothetical protein